VVNEALEPLSDILVGLSEAIIENGLEGKNKASSQVKVGNGKVATNDPILALKESIQYLGQSFAILDTFGVFFLVWWSKS